MRDLVTRAAELVSAAERIVVFTGAGISAESGIPTYRGESGVWEKYDPGKYADINFFREDPSYYWSFFRDVRAETLSKAKPNAAHLSIAHLEATGKLDAVVTQNIDGLHRAAGNEKVIELHGNSRVIGCLKCDADYGFEEICARLSEELPPRCGACGGVLKPRVVFFGEPLPSGAMEEAAQAASQCEVLLVIGSTLQVYPAASLPLIAKRSMAKVIIINVGETAMDELADVRIDAKAGEVLPGVVGLD